ncbi:HpcH/HpaI aldolase/citrate lyase family protein [Streptomyces bathyalis]|uniref:HpcH/HpaI aldolase/citrate lyase family protein n=1 Tax=Streptomyces bathyalis TaxID=2710756 RepID=UPI001FEC1AC7|nr:aldolase/citrate lyase family protein [Streptomyces bathyalis]
MSFETHESTGSRRAPLRSLLFVPAAETEWLTGTGAFGADAAILDLTDPSVPGEDKPTALARVVEALVRRGEAGDSGGAALFVRINPLDAWSSVEELRAVARPGLAGLVLPKVQFEQEMRTADRLLTRCEHEQGLPVGGIALVPLLDTARSLGDVRRILGAASRIAYTGPVITPGSELERTLGRRKSSRAAEAHALRARVLREIRGAGAAHPVTGVWSGVEDLSGLRRFAEQNRSLGYAGMLTAHPSHVPVINEVFSPEAGELARAERLIAAVREGQAQGAGAVTFEGRMVDEAMAANAQRIIRRHRRRSQ